MRPLQGSRLVLAVALASAAPLAFAAPPPPVRALQRPDTMVATVQQVNAQDSTIAALYGVSLALEVVDMAVAPTCTVMVDGRAGNLGDLRRGQVVRVRYRREDGALVAEAIEVLRSPGGMP